MNSLKDIFIFIGPPGAGKGSLSQQCIKSFGWGQLSTGALCRKHINEQTDIGKKIDFAIKSGKLVSDELIVEMVQKWLADNNSFFNALILDGFPRTTAQAHALHNFLFSKANYYKLNIVNLYISDEAVVNRLVTRLVCSNPDCQTVYSENYSLLGPAESMQCDNCNSELARRHDDSLHAVYDRLKIYHMHERQLLDFYATNGFLIKQVNVERPFDQVFEEFKVMINYN